MPEIQTHRLHEERTLLPTGVWALGLVSTRPAGPLPLERSFPFLRMARPASTLARAHASQFDLVWQEPQPAFATSTIRNDQHVTVNQEGQAPSGWKPLQERLNIGAAGQSNTRSREQRFSTPGPASVPFINSTLFLLSERTPAYSVKQSSGIDFTNSRNIPLARLVEQLPTPIKQNFSGLPDELLHTRPELAGLDNPVSNTRPPYQLNKAETQLPIQPLPYAISQLTLLPQVVESAVEQKTALLKNSLTSTASEPASRPEGMSANHRFSPLAPEMTRAILTDDYIRLLMTRLQELAREDRFRLGLGF